MPNPLSNLFKTLLCGAIISCCIGDLLAGEYGSRPRAATTATPQPNNRQVTTAPTRSQPQTSQVPSTIIYKICDARNKNVVSQVAFGNTLINPAPKSGCVDKNSISAQFTTDILKLRTNLVSVATASENNIRRQLAQLPEGDRDMAEEIIKFLYNTLSYTYFYTDAKTNLIPQINGDHINFMFMLATATYYNNKDAQSSYHGSVSYEGKIGKLKTQRATALELVEVLEGLRSRLKTITLDQSINVNTIKRKIKEDYTTNAPTQGGNNQQRTKVATNTVISNAGEALSAAIKTLRDTFKQTQLDDNTSYADVVETINQLAAPYKSKITALDVQLDILSDNVLKNFWVKLNSSYQTLASQFEPIMLLYRNTTPGSKVWDVFGGLIAAKDNKDSRIDGKKELSGVVLHKKGNDQRDELIFAFSGSNSSADWKHNVNFFEQEGSAKFNLLQGLEGHRGFIEAYDQSLGYMLARLKEWFQQNYGAQGQAKEVTITFTGHSLGGGLAQVGAVWAAQNIVPFLKEMGVKARVKIVSFAAPPVFTPQSATYIETKLISPIDNLRVYVEKDPVSTLGLSKGVNRNEQSLVMFILDRAHMGTPVALANSINGRTIGQVFDNVNRWKYHGADRYNNAIGIYKQTNAFKGMTSNVLQLFDKDFMQNLAQWRASLQLEAYLRLLPTQASPMRKQDGFTITQLQTIAESTNLGGTKPANLTLPQYPEARTYADQKGAPAGPKVARADVKSVQINVEGKSLNLNRSTSCDASSLLKAEAKSRAIDTAMVSCTCCVAKNLFVSQDDSLTSRFRGLLGKKVSTLTRIADHCGKYCKELKAIKNDTARVDYMGSLMASAGLGDQWNKKAFVFKD